MTRIPKDFKEFLILLNSKGVKYLVVGGYAVGFYGYPRPTGDIDIWIMISEDNAAKVTSALSDFGYKSPDLSDKLFLEEKMLIRLGYPPVRIKIMTSLTGVAFDDCYSRKVTDTVDGVEISFISLEDLKKNKKAIGSHKDLNDVEKLP
jgi:hypothetical protein